MTLTRPTLNRYSLSQKQIKTSDLDHLQNSNLAQITANDLEDNVKVRQIWKVKIGLNRRTRPCTGGILL